MGSVASFLFGCLLALCGCEEAPRASVPAPASSVSAAVAAHPAPAARARRYAASLSLPDCDPSSPRWGAVGLSVDTLIEKSAVLRERLRGCLPSERAAAFPMHVSLAIEPSGHTCGGKVNSDEPLTSAEAACLGRVTRAFRFPRSDARSELVVPLPR